MNLPEQIDQDLKSALLAGHKDKVSALKNLKNALQYAAVDKRSKDAELLTKDDIEAVLAREAKKRQEAADLYARAGQQARAAAELAEKAIISAYLPAAMTADEIKQVINEVIEEIGADAAMKGRIIGAVKQRTGNRAEGGEIARLVNESLDS